VLIFPNTIKAVLYFAPFIDNRATVTGMELNGSPLDPQSDADVSIIRFKGTDQMVLKPIRPPCFPDAGGGIDFALWPGISFRRSPGGI